MEITKTNEKGNLIISEEAIASIAINATKDVDGVGSFSNRPADVVNTIKKGSLKVMSPVRISQDGEKLDISIYINLLPNKKIRIVSENIQNSVREAIENMCQSVVLQFRRRKDPNIYKQAFPLSSE